MNRNEILDKVASIIREQLDYKGALVEGTSFDELDADSLDLVEVIMAIEDEFSLTVDDDVVLSIKTIKDVVDYLESH
ncbi:MAG: acyl carrier protein [Clostridia bacterium]|nr:acyl carrier protein [Clostridia bacterium]